VSAHSGCWLPTDSATLPHGALRAPRRGPPPEHSSGRRRTAWSSEKAKSALPAGRDTMTSTCPPPGTVARPRRDQWRAPGARAGDSAPCGSTQLSGLQGPGRGRPSSDSPSPTVGPTDAPLGRQVRRVGAADGRVRWSPVPPQPRPERLRCHACAHRLWPGVWSRQGARLRCAQLALSLGPNLPSRS